MTKRSVTILVADDDRDDCFMIREALQESKLSNSIFFVSNGVELLNYLRHQGEFSDEAKFPRPGLILLDLNMPKMDGREALKEIKTDQKLKDIPIVALTTSNAEEDVYKTYNLGVNSYIQKPVSFAGLVTIVKELGHYWFDIVELPGQSRV